MLEHEAPRALERGVSLTGPEHAQRRVGLDRNAQVGGTVLEERPAAVGALGRAHVLGQPLLHLRPRALEEAVEEDVLRVHRDVGFERRVPVPLGALQREKAVLRALDSASDAGGEIGGRAALVVELTRFCDSTLHP